MQKYFGKPVNRGLGALDIISYTTKFRMQMSAALICMELRLAYAE